MEAIKTMRELLVGLLGAFGIIITLALFPFAVISKVCERLKSRRRK
jgi:hypothetical protein